MITPNEKEWENMAVSSSVVLTNIDFTLVTKGNEGMDLIDHLTEKTDTISAESVDVYNVSGAGDTVVAVMATCLSMGHNPLTSAQVANECAGYVVTKPGTTVVPKNVFRNSLASILGHDF